MPIVPVIILEIFSGFIILISGSSIHNPKQVIHRILPFAFAQNQNPDQSTPAPDQSSDSSIQPDENSQPNTTQDSNSNSNPVPSDSTTPNPTEELQPTPGEINNLESNPPSASPTEAEKTASEQQTQNETVVSDESQRQAQDASGIILTNQDLISGPAEHINKEVEETSAMQDQKMDEAKSPDEKATLSVDFAKESVKEAEQSLKNDDLMTTVFVTQRISDQIDTAISSAQLSNNPNSLQKLSGFCKQADLILRTQQLSVPDETSQDFEIVRGKCLDVTQ